MKNRFYVYSYSAEKDGVFWVGKGVRKRIYDKHKECPLCYGILQKRKREGIKVTKKKLLENLTEQKAFLEEIILIYLYEPRANLTAGGEGASGHIKSSETRKKLSEAARGRKASQETREKMSEAQTGRKHSEESKKKMSESQKGKVLSKEHRRKLSEAKRSENNPNWGKTFSEKHRKKISEANKGEKHCNWGKVLPQETREKMSEAHKGLFSGERNPLSKLTWVQVNEIRERYKNEKITQAKLAKEYKVGQSAICRIISNRVWKTK